MIIQNEQELEGLKRVGRIVANCLQAMRKAMEPGMTTLELDGIGGRFLEAHGARSAPIHFYQFPGHTCISINHQVAHGIPGPTRIAAGDLVNIDVSAEMGGFVADTGGSFIAPPESDEKRNVCLVAKRALDLAVRSAQAGELVSTIGKIIEGEAERNRMSVIRNLGSHGVGRKLHEYPEFIAGYFDAQDKRRLKENMVITIEPFVSTGADFVEDAGDGWTLITEPEYLTAQYEHTLVVTNGKPLILTIPG